ncbi:hypothetical protein HHI36_000375 [Cryptolaemus montrouzieri]|uniref:Uncharacterized protein n=1 Tax=Cryptolaemus montrouzieri TaxID=559131 RepID=A0ABD2P4T7_9CUCU
MRAQSKAVSISISRSASTSSLNSKSTMWWTPVADKRGKHIVSWLAQLEMDAAGDRSPTLILRNSRSHIGVTLTYTAVFSLERFSRKWTSPVGMYVVITKTIKRATGIVRSAVNKEPYR